MQPARALRLLSLPTAVGLGTALALACSTGGPTSPEAVQTAPLFGSAKAVVVDDDPFAAKPCPAGYALTSTYSGDPFDANNNGQVCMKNGGGSGSGPKKH